MKRKAYILLAGAAILAGQACQPPVAPTTQQKQNNELAIAHEMERANRLAAERSQLQIEGYIHRLKLNGCKRLPNGIYIKIWGKPTAPHPIEEDKINVAYSLHLLDGTIIRDSDSSKFETLTLGRRDRTAGLDYAILAMQPGQKATAIIPSHLGYGLTGDGAKIPPHACLVYNIIWIKAAT